MRRQSVGGGTYVDEDEERQRGDDYGYSSQRPAAIAEGVEQEQVGSVFHYVNFCSAVAVARSSTHHKLEMHP